MYSFKANPLPSVANELRAGGCEADLTSPGELHSAMESGFDLSRALYGGPGKSAAEYAGAITSGVRHFSVESCGDLSRLSRAAGELGEPGAEHRETIASAATAAAAGGITTLCVLPDTDPPLDDPALLSFMIRRGEATGSVSLLPYGAATAGCAGKDLAEFGLLREAGAGAELFEFVVPLVLGCGADAKLVVEIPKYTINYAKEKH